MIRGFEDLIRWLYGIALFFLVIGLVNGVMGLKSLRSKSHPQAEVAWQQAPLSPWRYETLSMAAISIHSLGLLVLAVLLTLSVARTGIRPLLVQLAGWALFVSVFGLIFTSYMAGVGVAFLLAQQWIKPVSHGISGGGLWYGGSLYGWNSFDHYESGPEEGLISLYSSYSPPLRTWVLQPPAESVQGVIELVQSHLPPASVAAEPISWQRSPSTLLLGMTSLVLAALLPAAWGWLQTAPWLWMYCFAAFILVLALGNRLILVFGGQQQRSPEQM